MSRTFKNFLFFMIGFLIMIFAGIASAEQCVDLTSWGAAIYEGSSAYTGCNYMLLSISEYQEIIDSTSSTTPSTSFFLPPMSIEDANKIGGAIAVLFALCFCYNKSQDIL